MKTTLEKQSSLNRFTVKDIYHKLKWWILNDIQHQQHLEKTMKILSKNRLSGDKLIEIGYDKYKKILLPHFIKFMEMKTINIIFKNLNQWIQENKSEIKSKSSIEIGYIIYHYPLQNLLNYILIKKIDGLKFIESIKNDNDFIHKSTGWNKNDEVYQLQEILLCHLPFTTTEFEKNINLVILTNSTLSTQIKQEIKEKLLSFN